MSSFLLDAIISVIALSFLGIVGLVAGVAIPGMFSVAIAPWLDLIVPIKKKS